MIDVCVVGSANLDLIVTTPRLPGPGETVIGMSFAERAGGKGLNQVIAAARSGVRTAFVGAVGDDAAGRRLLAELDGAGVDTTSVAVVADRPSGRAIVTVDDDGENTIVVAPGANAAIAVSTLPTARVVLVQLEIPMEVVVSALRAARAQGALTVLNPAPAAEVPADVMVLVDIVVPNAHEAVRLGGAGALRRAGAGAVVTTLGADGATVVTAAGRWRQPPFAVATVDTTGAGDAFCGVLAARLARGDDLHAAVRVASAAGALATTRRGAAPSMPSESEIEAVLGGVTSAGAVPPSPHE